MRGFKGFNPDMTCRGMQYKVGEHYHTDEPIMLCQRGFHFCKTLSATFLYYDRSTSRFCEVKADNVIQGDNKCVCSDITIIRELSHGEVIRAAYGDGDGNGDGYGDGYGNGDGDGYGINIQNVMIWR